MAIMGGRNVTPLDERDQRRVLSIFTGLDDSVRTVSYDKDAKTVFKVVSADDSDDGEEYGQIIFGPDIYPGPGIGNPNAELSMKAAAAHELSHYHRWFNKTEINDLALESLDEALTSLDAVMRYESKLHRTDVLALIADASHRMSLFIQDNDAE